MIEHFVVVCMPWWKVYWACDKKHLVLFKRNHATGSTAFIWMNENNLKTCRGAPHSTVSEHYRSFSVDLKFAGLEEKGILK